MRTSLFRTVVLVTFLWVNAGAACSQTRREIVREKIDSAVTARYFDIKYDTGYIARPAEPWMVKVRGNLSGFGIDVDRRVEGAEGRSRLRTGHKVTMSVGVNYRGIAAGLAFNPASWSGKNKDFELNLNAYANRYGVDVVYLNSKTLSGHASFEGEVIPFPQGAASLKMLNVNAYYAFNGHRFSYPAAFSQSYIQRRSAGSWLVGLSYMGGRVKTMADEAAGLSNMRVYLGSFGVGVGYGYNWVVNKKLLLHLSALPTLVLVNRNNVEVGGVRRDMETEFPDAIFTERMSFVYSYSKKCFVGGSCVVTLSVLGDDRVDINYAKWRARLFWGIRLYKTKKR